MTAVVFSLRTSSSFSFRQLPICGLQWRPLFECGTGRGRTTDTIHFLSFISHLGPHPHLFSASMLMCTCVGVSAGITGKLVCERPPINTDCGLSSPCGEFATLAESSLISCTCSSPKGPQAPVAARSVPPDVQKVFREPGELRDSGGKNTQWSLPEHRRVSWRGQVDPAQCPHLG